MGIFDRIFDGHHGSNQHGGGHHGGSRHGNSSHHGSYGTFPDSGQRYVPPPPVVPQATAGATCPKCCAITPVGSKFCPQCGTSMAFACTQCGAGLQTGSRFCGQCGKPAP
ncbi:zinc ribbon domain-containing protein [Azohydromonas lata]|uniref:zinc ribbon domain-containing protein n=1 Tax=Azohydromonas lata TaxID=45677 RepID=UPI0009FDC3F2|nr:zinc ribbon domain-containing protein [Azohydromonas lata]